MLPDISPVVLSQGVLCEDMGYFCNSSHGEPAYLSEDGKFIQYQTGNLVHVVAIIKECSGSGSHLFLGRTHRTRRKDRDTRVKGCIGPTNSVKLMEQLQDDSQLGGRISTGS